MRSRYPLLWLKKRGKRRSGSPRWGHSGELVYHGVFVVVGLAAGWWHAASVGLPHWREQQAIAGFLAGQCEIVATRVDQSGDVYVPAWRVRPIEGNAVGDPVDATASRTVDSRRQAERIAQRFSVGKRVACWIDPEDPMHVVLQGPSRWWQWLLLLAPLALVSIGVVGLVQTVLRAGASVERRHAVAQRASRFDPLSGSRVSVALATALPPTHDVDDSPGVKLRFRLPSEGASSWRLAGATVMCVTWNLLVGFFLIGVIGDLVAGRPNWAITVVVTPLACGGGWLAYSLLRDAWGATGVGVTQVEITTHPLIPGQTGGGVVLQAGQFRARWLTVALVCDEIATFCEGTDTRVSTREVFRQLLHCERRFRVEIDRPFEQAFTFTLPDDAMHSLLAPHNEVRWSLEVRGKPMRWPEFRRRFRLCVYPANWDAPPPPTGLAAQLAGQAT